MPDAKIVPLGPVSQWDDSSQRALRRMKTWKGQANALCHRDYTTGTSVQVNVYMDFIEIMSPGLFPEGDSPDRHLEGSGGDSKQRNPNIAWREKSSWSKRGSGG